MFQEDLEMEKSNVISLLHADKVNVEFVKKDGTTRLMTCTLSPKFLPQQIDIEEEIQKKTINPSVLAVFDTINNGWRSFRWDSLKVVNGQSFNVE